MIHPGNLDDKNIGDGIGSCWTGDTGLYRPLLDRGYWIVSVLIRDMCIQSLISHLHPPCMPGVLVCQRVIKRRKGRGGGWGETLVITLSLAVILSH